MIKKKTKNTFILVIDVTNNYHVYVNNKRYL